MRQTGPRTGSPIHAGMTCLIAGYLLMIAATAMLVVAAAVGDRERLRSSYAAGVPLHQAPRGTRDFRRVPDGTVATMTEVAQEGRWLRLTLPGGDPLGRRRRYRRPSARPIRPSSESGSKASTPRKLLKAPSAPGTRSAKRPPPI
jgi:hypothetical protein